jgi:hypothetical protein
MSCVIKFLRSWTLELFWGLLVVPREKINDNENGPALSTDDVSSTGVKKSSVGDPLHA